MIGMFQFSLWGILYAFWMFIYGFVSCLLWIPFELWIWSIFFLNTYWYFASGHYERILRATGASLVAMVFLLRHCRWHDTFWNFAKFLLFVTADLHCTSFQWGTGFLLEIRNPPSNYWYHIYRQNRIAWALITSMYQLLFCLYSGFDTTKIAKLIQYFNFTLPHTRAWSGLCFTSLALPKK